MRKKQVPRVARGDVFLVPLLDDTFAVGQILGVECDAFHAPACALFDLTTEQPKVESCPLTVDHLVASLFVTPDLLAMGVWPVVATSEVRLPASIYPYESTRKHGFVGAVVEGSAIVQEFMNAFHALAPWDAWHDPNFLDSLLISPSRKPTRLMYKRLV